MKSALLVACLGLAIASLSQASSYGGGGASDASYASGSSGGYSNVGYTSGGDGGYGGGHAGGYGGYERPRVNLGISLKVPAMKINLGRMNMPKISIRAKIKQGHGPKVLNVPEMHIDTNSKIPGPEGARAVSHGAAGYEPQSGYTAPSSYADQSGGYQQQPSQYQAPSISYEAPPSSGGYGGSAQEYGPSNGGYQAPQPAYNPEPSYEAAPAAYGGGPAPNGGYEVASYDDSAAPASYSQQAGSGYSTAAASSHSNAAVAPAYGKSQQQQQTRPQHASNSPSVYSQPMKQAASYNSQSTASYQQQQQAPVYASAERGYGNSAASSYPQAPAQSSYQQSPSSYSQGSSSYQQAPGAYPTSYSPTPASYGKSHSSYGANSGYSSPAQAVSGFSSNPTPTYGSAAQDIGYQPIQPEPGHTIITSTNDNYEGLTRMTWTSEPVKDHRSSYGASNSYGSGSGSGYGGGQQKPASYSQQAPAAYSAPSAPAAYQQRPVAQSAYQPVASNDDSAMNQAGNYGSRMGYQQQQPQMAYAGEAY